MTHTCTYSNFILVQISLRSYRAYCLFRSPVRVTEIIAYSEVSVGTTDQNDTHLFSLIPSYGYYHITMGIPRPVLINE